MNVRQGWVVLSGVALLVASACGGDGGQTEPGRTNDAGAGGESLSTEAGTSSKPAGGGGASDNASGGVAGEVAPPGGSAGDGAGGATGGEGGAPVVVANDIHGSIYGRSDELVVLVDGVNVPIDADGHFNVPDAPDEYQLVICAPNYTFMQVWDGLRSRTPLVDIGTGFGDPPYGAIIRGKASGGLPVPVSVAADETVFTQLAYSSEANGYLYPLSSIDPPEGFELKPQWSGATTDSGEVLALQYVFKTKVGVNQYTGFARRPMNIMDGSIYGSLSGSAATDVQLTAPAVTTITGHFSLPDGWTRNGSFVHVGPFTTDSVVEGDFSLLVPQLQGLPMWVLIQADGPDGRADFKAPVPAKSPWNIEVPGPPKALLPVANANAVTESTVFSWNGLPAGALTSIYWEIGDWRIQRYTSSSSTTLPDLSPFGATLPAATEGTWVVEAIGPAATTDDILVLNHGHDTAEPSYFIDSVDRLFTTAP